MIIGLVITIPSCIACYIIWIKNKRDKTGEGEILVINYISWKEVGLAVLSQAIMGVGYYYFLQWLGTEELLFSTFALCTCILDAYLLLRRTALAEWLEVGDNLITAGLWLMLALKGDFASITFVVQYVFLFFYCIYGSLVWRKNRKEQTGKHKTLK